MTTFQVIILAIVRAVTEILPVSPEIHMQLFTKALGWEITDTTVLEAIRWGVFSSLFLYFRHDWSSIISSLIQVILFRKKPMTFDERFPFFLIFVIAPYLLVKKFIGSNLDAIIDFRWTVTIASLLASVVLIRAQQSNRRLKSLFIWNWLDSLGMGIVHLLQYIPGVGHLVPFLGYSAWKHYHWDAVIKYSLLCMTPFTLMAALEPATLAAGATASEWSSMNVLIAGALSTVSAYFAISGLNSTIEGRRIGAYGWYRLVMTLMVAGLSIWL